MWMVKNQEKIPLLDASVWAGSDPYLSSGSWRTDSSWQTYGLPVWVGLELVMACSMLFAEGTPVYVRTLWEPPNPRTTKGPQINFLSISFRPVCGPLMCTQALGLLLDFQRPEQFSCYSLHLEKSFLALHPMAGSFFSIRTQFLLRCFLWLSCHHAVCNLLLEHYGHVLWTT